MTFDEYQKKAYALANKFQDPKLEIATWALGVTGEGGEVADHIKKHLGHDHPLDKDLIRKELGDVMWYIAAMCTSLGLSLEDVAEKNIEKLTKRYPQGFSTEKSINRTES